MILVVFSIIDALTEGDGIFLLLIIYQSLLMCFVILQCWIEPFKTTGTNVVDSFFVVTAIFVYSLGGYYGYTKHSYDDPELCKTYYTIMSIVFTIFILIVLHHIVWFVQPVRHRFVMLSNYVVKLLNDACTSCASRSLVGMNRDTNYGATIQQSYNCDNFRESLLSTTSTS